MCVIVRARDSVLQLYVAMYTAQKVKEHFENSSDLNVKKKKYVEYLYRYGQGNVLGTKWATSFNEGFQRA